MQMCVPTKKIVYRKQISATAAKCKSLDSEYHLLWTFQFFKTTCHSRVIISRRKLNVSRSAWEHILKCWPWTHIPWCRCRQRLVAQRLVAFRLFFFCFGVWFVLYFHVRHRFGLWLCCSSLRLRWSSSLWYRLLFLWSAPRSLSMCSCGCGWTNGHSTFARCDASELFDQVHPMVYLHSLQLSIKMDFLLLDAFQ